MRTPPAPATVTERSSQPAGSAEMAGAPDEPVPGTAAVEDSAPASPATFVTSAITPDGTHHRLWAVTDPKILADVAADLEPRHALIADGHHRYATYRQLAARRRPDDGAGPWDRGLALLVDSSAYGPEVHPIHRAIPSLPFDEAVARAGADFEVSAETGLDAALATLGESDPTQDPDARFAAVVTDGTRAMIVSNPQADAVTAARVATEPAALSALDVWVLHRVPHRAHLGSAGQRADCPVRPFGSRGPGLRPRPGSRCCCALPRLRPSPPWPPRVRGCRANQRFSRPNRPPGWSCAASRTRPDASQVTPPTQVAPTRPPDQAVRAGVRPSGTTADAAPPGGPAASGIVTACTTATGAAQMVTRGAGRARATRFSAVTSIS